MADEGTRYKTLTHLARAMLKRAQQQKQTTHSLEALMTVKQHFAVSQEAHRLLEPLLRFAAPRRQVHRETFLDTPDFVLARNNVWLRLREGGPNALHRRRWSLKILSEEGDESELNGSEQDIIDCLRARGYISDRRDAVESLRRAFPTNLATFDTDRISVDLNGRLGYEVSFDLTRFFAGEYYLTGTLRLMPSSCDPGALRDQLPGASVVASPPSKVIEYIRRFHQDLYRELCESGVIQDVVAAAKKKAVSEMTRFSAPPPFWPLQSPHNAPAINPETVKAFHDRYLVDARVPDETTAKLLAIPGVVGYAVGAHPDGTRLNIIVYVRGDPDAMRLYHPLLAEPQFHLSKLSRKAFLFHESKGPTLDAEEEDEEDEDDHGIMDDGDSDDDSGDDEQEKLLAQEWQQLLGDDVSLGEAKPTSWGPAILARNGVSPALVNEASLDQRHPLLISVGFERAEDRTNVILAAQTCST